MLLWVPRATRAAARAPSACHVLSIHALDHALHAGCKLPLGLFHKPPLCVRGQRGLVPALASHTGRIRLELIIPLWSTAPSALPQRGGGGELGLDTVFPLFDFAPLTGSFFLNQPQNSWGDDRACAQAGFGLLLIGLCLCVTCDRCPSASNTRSATAPDILLQAKVDNEYFFQ